MNAKQAYKDANKKIDKALIEYGRDVAEIAKEVIQRDVYDYYDNIRAGNVEEAYNRTGELLNIRAFHSGKGHVSIRYEGHTPEILNYIQRGSTNWSNSQLYQLSQEKRRREFIKNTMEELKNRDIIKEVSVKLYKYGIRVSRR